MLEYLSLKVNSNTKVYKTVIQMNKKDELQCYYLLSNLYEIKGDMDKAEDILNEALRKSR